jgi:DNA-binding winged helix-turn-helix (wHTH) protein/tetratricopeptide (TPR) repeat protein
MKRFRSFRLDPVNECLWRESDGERMPLTRKAFAVLNHLVTRAGRLVTKDELMDIVWPGTYVQEEILKSYVRKLRQVLGDDARSPSFIGTQTGRGYRFIAPVTEDLSAVPDPTAVRTAKRLFGRDAELARLRTSYERALRGERQVVFITGEPGIGKTALIEAFLWQAAADSRACIATGQCIESFHQQEAYYPVLEAVGRMCQAPQAAQVVELLAQHAPTWLAQFPSLMTKAHRESLQREILGATRERMLRELSGALEALSAATPIVLVLEDLHWADRATLDVIAALARRHEPARLLLLATYRPVEVILAEHPLKQLKHELGIQRRSQELPLDVLSKAAVAEYLANQFPGNSFSADLGELIHQQTDGNPLFMVTAVEYLVAHGLIREASDTETWQLNARLDQVRSSVPKSLQQTIGGQIDRLTADEREVLQTASIDGVEFTSRMVAAGLRRDVARVDACCDSLAQRQWMLRETGLEEFPDGSCSARYQFTHSLYREVLYRRCSPAAKVRLHHRLGEELERAYAANPADVAADLARHFQEGRDYARAVRYLRVAATTAARRYAYREAVAILESAQTIVGKLPEAARGAAELDVLEQLATVRDVSGERSAAADLYQTLAECAAQLGDGETEARALINVAHQLRWSSPRPALAIYERAAQIGIGLGSTSLQADAEANACFLRLGVFGWRPEWAETLKRWVDWMLDAGELDRFALNARVSAHVRMHSADYEGAARVASRAKSVAIEVGATASYLYCGAHCGWSLASLGRLGEALSNLREAIEIAERHGDGLFGAYIKLVLADLHSQAFDFATADRFCEEALRVVDGSGFTHALQWALVSAAAVQIGLGDYDRALERLADLQALYERVEVLFGWYWQMPTHGAGCEARLALGDLTRARQEAERLRALSEQTAERAWQARACHLRARVALAEGDSRLARSEIVAALRRIEGLTAPFAAWRIYETAADLNQLTGRSSAAARYQQLRNATLRDLANSLADEEPLRQSILAAIAKARLQRSRLS